MPSVIACRHRRSRAQACRRDKAERERRGARSGKRRAADAENKRRVNREVVGDLVAAGLTEEQAKAVVTAIARARFCNVRIAY